MSKRTLVAALIIIWVFMLNAFGQVTHQASRKSKVKKTSGLITEIGFPALKTSSPKSKRKPIVKWEGPSFDASKNFKPQIKHGIKRAKSTGYIGETEKNFSKKRRSSKSKVKKNQDIEVENEETHRTKHLF